jgi:hypothetical protein
MQQGPWKASYLARWANATRLIAPVMPTLRGTRGIPLDLSDRYAASPAGIVALGDGIAVLTLLVIVS